ncbi:hypothetical protein SK3146_04550 [Paenibacillus konkukensis]|uniref:Copper amine oxidase-like N-terminal domain-containing protein n=1 Tax=Paenibacillus konkukensis TaxID=2020716 RepID=A0ABY4RRT5_9BACL|nr:hypothetical protein [Paenibacillus konkukensis]UQZ85261.1 hypothetical protein SK3146_04550 [Paenibacillus konkukensis]
MKIKKLWPLVAILLAVSASISWTPHAQADTEVPIGTPIGTVLTTDIKADIHGEVIPSMNIDGYTAIAAEDLRRYGFDVAWIPKYRRVEITYTPGKPISPLEDSLRDAVSIGEKIGDVLSTDIRVYYFGQPIPSYNIEGRTAISLNDLSSFGQVEWKEQDRKLSYIPSVKFSHDSLKDAPPLVVRLTNAKGLGPISVTGSDLRLDGAAFGRVVGDDPMLPVRQLAEKLGYETEWRHDGSLVIDDGTSRFHIINGLSGPMQYWLGGEAEGFDWYRSPVIGSEEIFIHEQDVRSLFGCTTESVDSSNEGISFSLSCAGYQVEDHGVPQTFSGLKNGLQTVTYLGGNKFPAPELQLYNAGEGRSLRSNLFHISEGGAAEGGYAKYTLASEAPNDTTDNNMVLQLTDGHKILYKKVIFADGE